MQGKISDIERFNFRNLHPRVFLGTASDRYAGWIGQIYSERFAGQTARRPRKFRGKRLVEEVLPVESVEEYFQHFGILELDFTFYSLLLEENGEPTRTFQVLRSYRKHLRPGDRLLLKVPQVIFARKLRRGNRFVPNESYLNADLFTRLFYEPAVKELESALEGFVFEQEYQRRDDCPTPEREAAELEGFFDAVPKDARYHVEFRTERFLSPPLFHVLERRGIGQVLSHWTWLPSLRRQFALSGHRFFNSSKRCVVRLMTPRGMRYEDAYVRAHPFNALVKGMITPGMVEDTARLMRRAATEGATLHVVVNNRAGGNAPMIAQLVAKAFLGA